MTNIIEVKTVEELDLALSANEKVIVDVWADWCGSCKMMLPMLSGIVSEDTSLTLVKVNADEAVDVVKHFGIRSLPTFIFHKDGNAVSTFVGSSTKSDFLKKINENFQ